MSLEPGPRCPAWCVVRHGDLLGEDDLVHSSGELLVGQITLRLCAGAVEGHREGPYVLVGDHELTVHESEVLIAALTQLVDLASAHADHAWT
jgi:hypothetical protein